MQLYTFRARSLAEALRQIRQELGSEASVLHTREVSGGLTRWLGNRIIEVTASLDVAVPSRLESLTGEPVGAVAVGRTAELPPSETRPPRADLADYRLELRTTVLRRASAESSLVEQLAAAQVCGQPAVAEIGDSLPAAMAGLASQLACAGIRGSTARRWLGVLAARLADEHCFRQDLLFERLQHIVAAELPVRGPIALPLGRTGRPTLIAFVGPTGVGKTTTVAKLAASFQVDQRRRVGLVAGDVSRIAAIEQLRAYAGIMDLSMEVVASPGQIAPALERLSDCDVVLFDTAGFSPYDSLRLSELRSLLDAAAPDEVQLVVSAVADADSLATTIHKFAEVGTQGLILTKIDEAHLLGRLADWLASCPISLSYITHGQDVPGNLRPASALGLAELLIAGSRERRFDSTAAPWPPAADCRGRPS